MVCQENQIDPAGILGALRYLIRFTVPCIGERMHEKAHTREAMMPNGEVLESVSYKAIHYVLYVNALVLWIPQRLWIILFRIEET